MNRNWRSYWSRRTDGGHRSSDDSFLRKEAAEKLYFIEGGDTLLDFGCGACELMQYYAPHFKKLVGVDFSESMLEEARKKLEGSYAPNIRLALADDRTVWSRIDGSFDRIVCSGVVQYLDVAQLQNFLDNASKRLNLEGKILLFDVIDSRIRPLARAGLFTDRPNPLVLVGACATMVLRRYLDSDRRILPTDELGYSYDPNLISEMSMNSGLEVEFVRSMYYEYRYHAVLTRTNKMQRS